MGMGGVMNKSKNSICRQKRIKHNEKLRHSEETPYVPRQTGKTALNSSYSSMNIQPSTKVLLPLK